MFKRIKDLADALEGPIYNYGKAKKERGILQEIKKEAQRLRIEILEKYKTKNYDEPEAIDFE